jgi:hypothetical protein
MVLHGSGGHDLSSVKYFALFSAVLGVALLFRLVIAQIVFETLVTAIGLFLIFGSMFYVPFPWMFLNILFATPLMIPLTLTITSWRKMRTTTLHAG